MYATVADYKLWRQIKDDKSDPLIGDALTAASAWIDEYCQTTFADSGATSQRLYHQTVTGKVYVDDFSTLTGLVVVDDETTLTINEDFRVGPNGSSPVFNRLTFWPYRWAAPSWEPLVAVTARWGWAAVPTLVEQACRRVAADLIADGQGTYGVVGLDAGVAVRTRVNSTVASLLASYRRADRVGAL